MYGAQANWSESVETTCSESPEAAALARLCLCQMVPNFAERPENSSLLRAMRAEALTVPEWKQRSNADERSRELCQLRWLPNAAVGNLDTDSAVAMPTGISYMPLAFVRRPRPKGRLKSEKRVTLLDHQSEVAVSADFTSSYAQEID